MVLVLASHHGEEMAVRIEPGRRDDILDAALKLLRGSGLAGVTTAGLAREARCSKDTLYMLFEDRDAILAALIDRQASELNAALQHSDQSASPVEALTDIGTGLLTLLTSEASLAINRAALADPTGNLSRILIKRGKERSAPKIVALIEELDKAGIIAAADTLDAYRTFYGLLIADRQILALHGVHEGRGKSDAPDGVAARAVERFLRIYAPQKDAQS
jgi:AcrR family transcriptional regulator